MLWTLQIRWRNNLYQTQRVSKSSYREIPFLLWWLLKWIRTVTKVSHDKHFLCRSTYLHRVWRVTYESYVPPSFLVQPLTYSANIDKYLNFLKNCGISAIESRVYNVTHAFRFRQWRVRRRRRTVPNKGAEREKTFFFYLPTLNKWAEWNSYFVATWRIVVIVLIVPGLCRLHPAPLPVGPCRSLVSCVQCRVYVQKEITEPAHAAIQYNNPQWQATSPLYLWKGNPLST